MHLGVRVASLVGMFTLAAQGGSMLFLDTFDAAESEDINIALGPPRQSGTLVGPGISYSEVSYNFGPMLVPERWQTQVNNPGQPNRLLLAPNGSPYPARPEVSVSPNADFSIAAPVEVSVKATSGGDWVMLRAGLSGTARVDSVFTDLSGGGINVLLRPNGGVQVFAGGSVNIADSAEDLSSGNPLSRQGADVLVVLSFTSFAGGAGALSVTVGGIPVDLDSGPGVSLTHSYSSLGGGHIQLVGYSGIGAGVAFDDLTVEVIPEPSTLGLIALGGLVLRRRRASR